MCLTPDKEPDWNKPVQEAAGQLLKERKQKAETITSLDFKNDLRAVIGEREKVSQTNVSRFLRGWFQKSGKKDGYKASEGRHITYSPVVVPAIQAAKQKAEALLKRELAEVTPKEYREALEALLKEGKTK